MYYLKNSDQEYFSEFWMQERKYLTEVGAKLLTVDEANNHPFNDLLNRGINDTKPYLNTDYNYFCIPYELDEEIEGESSLLAEKVISDLINENLLGKFYIASTDAELGCFGECNYIDEKIIWNFSSPHLNTPFLIFDDNKEFFALIDYDLPLQIIGYRKNIIDNNHYIENRVGQSGWNNIFDRYDHYNKLSYIFKNYYEFLLPKEIDSVLDSKTTYSSK